MTPHHDTDWTLPPRSSASWQLGDVRERVARLETGATFAAHSIQQHHDRLLTGDGRFSRIEERMAKLEEEGRRAIEDLTKVKALPERLDAIEARSRAWKDILQYAAAGLVLVLALLGKVSMPEALKMFGKAFGL